jgi:hypothetical protein
MASDQRAMAADPRKLTWMAAVLAERSPLRAPPSDRVRPTRPVRVPGWMLAEVEEIAVALGMRAIEVVAVILFSYLGQRGDGA